MNVGYKKYQTLSLYLFYDFDNLMPIWMQIFSASLDHTVREVPRPTPNFRVLNEIGLDF